QPTCRQLAALALRADLDQIMSTSRPGSLIQILDDVFDRLDQMAQDSDVRILVYSEPRRVVVFDSADSLEAGTTLNGTIEDYPITQRFMRNIIVPIASGIAGSFVDKGQEWLFFGLSRLRSLRGESYYILFADPRPTQSLQDALTEFGTELLPLLAQAAVVGMLVALALAILISRSIAQPLQTVAK